MEMPDADSIKAGFDGVRSVLDTYKRLRELFKSHPEKHKELGERIKLAEKEIQLAEAQIAQALGYKLCKAHFPPIPMLLDRVHSNYVGEISKCPECRQEDPSPERVVQIEKNEISQKHPTPTDPHVV